MRKGSSSIQLSTRNTVSKSFPTLELVNALGTMDINWLILVCNFYDEPLRGRFFPFINIFGSGIKLTAEFGPFKRKEHRSWSPTPS